MRHMVVVYQIEDNADISEMLPMFPQAKSIYMTPGIKRRQTSTEEKTVAPYAQYFNAKSSNSFTTDIKFQEYNWLFLRTQQNWANDLVRARGYLFLNEVLGMLGMPSTPLGQVVGWISTKDAPEEKDPSEPRFIDFGCWDGEGHPSGERTGAILLDFNVQGPILHAIA